MKMSADVRLTQRQEAAARLIAKGASTDEAIALDQHLSPKTVQRWRHVEAFALRVQALQAEMAAAVVSEGIAVRTQRVAALNDRWERMQRVIAERAGDPVMADVAGGSTGLLVHSFKMIGAGRDATTVDEYAVDVGLLKELRAHEEQAAKELGQWVEKTRGELSGLNGGPVEHTFTFTIQAPNREADQIALGEGADHGHVAGDGTTY